MKEAQAAVAFSTPLMMNNATAYGIAEKVVEKNEIADRQKVGNHLAFVAIAYILVFAVWNAAASYDFISSKWRTAGSMRKNSKRHLCILLAPMAYMVAYIKYQYDARDYKEMCAGVIALLFALVEFIRTVMGMWQLHVFRHWTVASIRSIESLGYVAQENDGAHASDASLAKEDIDNDGARASDADLAKEVNDDDRVFRIADNLRVNDLIIDNRLTEGEIEYKGNGEAKQGNGKAKKGTMSTWARWVSCIWDFPIAIWSSRSPGFSSPEDAFYFEPCEPEDVFMRWACVLVGQVFPQWLEDMRASGISDMSSDDGLTEQLSRFRRGILCSAALHTKLCVHMDKHDEGQAPPSSAADQLFFDPEEYPKLCKGVFSLQEFLSVACTSGKGIPFGVPHENAKDRKSPDYSYSKFKSNMRLIREMFPVDDVEKLEHFETSHLEWLAVFLSVPDWIPHTSSNSNPRRKGSTSIAQENLLCQLGLPLSSSKSNATEGSAFFSESLRSFPLFKGILKRTSCGNRNVLEVSLHIDNLLALTAGSQCASMIEMKNEMSKRITDAMESLGISDLKEPYSPDESANVESHHGQEEASSQLEQNACAAESHDEGEDKVAGLECVHSSKELSHEEELFTYQMSEDSELAVLEQRLNFLGCCMEFLRSSLATWVHHNPRCEESVWSPSLQVEHDRRGTFSFRLSELLARCVRGDDSGKRAGEKSFQAKLLWELQSYFIGELPKEGISPQHPEAIILCILSFPSVQLSVAKHEEEAELGSVNTCDGVSIPMQQSRKIMHVTLSVPRPPQQIHVSVQLCCAGHRAIDASVSVSGEGKFVWEKWRGNFSSRLAAAGVWKQQNGLQCPPVVSKEVPISTRQRSAKLVAFGTGKEMRVWLGWPPHRPSMGLFEVQSINFIMRKDQEQFDLQWREDWDVQVSTGLTKYRQLSVDYESADSSDIEHASTVASHVLSKVIEQDVAAQVDLAYEGKSMLADLKDLENSRETRFDSQLKIAESVAVHHQNFEALETLVRAVCDLKRATKMLENFCLLIGTQMQDFGMGSPGLRMADEIMAQKILRLMKDLVARTPEGHSAGSSLARISTSFVNYDYAENMKFVVHYLLRTILSATFRLPTPEIQAMKRAVASIVGRIGGQNSPIALHLFQRGYEGRTEYQVGLESTNFAPTSPTLSAKLFSIGAWLQKDSTCLRALAAMYLYGFHGNHSQPVRAVELYTRAVDEGDVDAMYHLGNLVKQGAEGVDADAVRAVELYTRAVDDGHVFAMYNLGNLLEQGAEGVDADPVRAVELYTQAVDIGEVNSLVTLARLLAKGGERVDGDRARALSLYTRFLEVGGHSQELVSRVEAEFGALRNLQQMNGAET